MRYISFIMSLLILTLTVLPCADVADSISVDQNEVLCEHLHKEGSPKEHNHQHDDECSPFCHCNCCRVPITIQYYQNHHFEFVNTKIITKVSSLYSSNYQFDTSCFIWHPPKTIA